MSEHSTAICRLCQERKSQIEFPQHSNKKLMPDGSYMVYNANRRCCFSCLSIQQKEAELKRFGSVEARADYCRIKSQKCMFKKFGLTLDEGYTLIEKQNHKCKICERAITLERTKDRNSKAVLDHCHETGKFRGFLCHSCNVALGLLNDNVQTLEKAIAYISSTS